MVASISNVIKTKQDVCFTKDNLELEFRICFATVNERRSPYASLSDFLLIKF